MPSADEIRDAQRVTWSGLSAGWEKWDAVIVDQLGPVGDAMIERLDLAPDHRVLDIASGTGEPGLSMARHVPQGRVVLTDLVAEMLDIAERRAQAQGITNIETQVCSADALPFDDATFDGVSVRFGYMFFPDAATATAEFVARAEAGRTALCVGLGQARGEPVDVDRDAGDRDRGGRGAAGSGRAEHVPVRGPGIRRRAYEAEGLRDIDEWDVGVELVTESPEQYWEMISEHVSLAVAALQQVDEAARDRIRATRLQRCAPSSATAGSGSPAWPGASWERNRPRAERSTASRRDFGRVELVGRCGQDTGLPGAGRHAAAPRRGRGRPAPGRRTGAARARPRSRVRRWSPRRIGARGVAGVDRHVCRHVAADVGGCRPAVRRRRTGRDRRARSRRTPSGRGAVRGDRVVARDPSRHRRRGRRTCTRRSPGCSRPEACSATWRSSRVRPGRSTTGGGTRWARATTRPTSCATWRVSSPGSKPPGSRTSTASGSGGAWPCCAVSARPREAAISPR